MSGLIWCVGGQEKPFESIMCKPDDTRFDICRMFLATLQVRRPSPGCSIGCVAERRWFWQLANNGNVHIHAEESGPTTALRLKVRLHLCAVDKLILALTLSGRGTVPLA